MARYQKNTKLSQHQKAVTDAYCRVLNREANIGGLVASSKKLSDGATVKDIVADLAHTDEFEDELFWSKRRSRMPCGYCAVRSIACWRVNSRAERELGEPEVEDRRREKWSGSH